MATLLESQSNAGGPLSPKYGEYAGTAANGATVRFPAVTPMDGDGNPILGAPIVSTLLNAVTTTQTGSAVAANRGNRSVQATVSGTGAVSATVSIYGNTTNSNSGGVLVGTISLSGTTSNSDGFISDSSWPYLYADLTAISGTSAAVTVKVAI